MTEKKKKIKGNYVRKRRKDEEKKGTQKAEMRER